MKLTVNLLLKLNILASPWIIVLAGSTKTDVTSSTASVYTDDDATNDYNATAERSTTTDLTSSTTSVYTDDDVTTDYNATAESSTTTDLTSSMTPVHTDDDVTSEYSKTAERSTTTDLTSSTTSVYTDDDVTTDYNATAETPPVPNLSIAFTSDLLTSTPTGCDISLIDSKYLADVSIEATSVQSDDYNPYTSYLVAPPPASDIWCPDPGDSHPSLTINFRQKLIVKKLVLRGGASFQNGWIKYFRLGFVKEDNETARLYYPDGSNTKEFMGCTDASTSVTRIPPKAMLTSSISIYPLTWKNNACLKLDIIGCIPNSCDTHTMLPGETFTQGDTLCTDDGMAYAVMASDGLHVYNKAETHVLFDAIDADLVLSADALALEQAATTLTLYQGNNLDQLTFTSDGNLCLYNNGSYTVWCSHSGGLPGYELGGPRCKSLIKDLRPNSLFVTSSVRADSQDDISYVFLNTPHIPGIQRGGWCADPTDSNPYIEIHLPAITLVYGITVQIGEVKLGDGDAVTQYRLYYKARTEMPDWTHIYNEPSIHYYVPEFDGPQERTDNAYTTSYFTDPLLAQVIKLEMVQVSGNKCLRLDLLQCQDNKAQGGRTYYKEEGVYQYLPDEPVYVTDTDTDTCQYIHVHPTLPEVVIDFTRDDRLVTEFNFMIGRNSDSFSRFNTYVSVEAPDEEGNWPPDLVQCSSYDDVMLDVDNNHYFNCTNLTSTAQYFILDVLDDILGIEICRFRIRTSTAIISRRKPCYYRKRLLYFTKETSVVTDGIHGEPCFSSPVHSNPGLYVDLGEDMVVSQVTLTSHGTYDNMVGVYIAVMASTVTYDPLYYIWLGSFGHMSVCDRVTSAFSSYETRTIQCGSSLYGRYILVFRISSAAAVSLCQLEVLEENNTPNSMPVADYESGWQNFDLADPGADSALQISYTSETLPVYIRTMVATDTNLDKDTFVYDGFPSNWASAAICGLSIYYTDTDIWVIRRTTPFCMTKFLCQDTSQWEWRGSPSPCPHDNVHIKIQTWSFCSLEPAYMSAWTDVWISGSVDEISVEFDHGLNSVPTLAMAQLEITGTSGTTFYTPGFGSLVPEAKGSVIYTESTVTVYTPTIIELEGDLSEAEAGFTIATVRVRVLVWSDLGSYPQSWTIDPVTATSPNTIQLPGVSVDQMLILVRTKLTNLSGGSPLYNTGQLLPYSPFYKGFVYAIRDHKLVFWWNDPDGDTGDYPMEIITIHYYHIGKDSPTSCQPLTVLNSTIADTCAPTGESVVGKCFMDPQITINQTCTGGSWLPQQSCQEVTWSGHGGHEYLYQPGHVTVDAAKSLCQISAGNVLSLGDINQLEHVINTLMSSEGPSWSTHIDLSRSLIQFSGLADFWAASSLSGVGLIISDMLLSDDYTGLCATLALSAGVVTLDENDCSVTDDVICERSVCTDSRDAHLTFEHRQLSGTPISTFTAATTFWQEYTCLQRCEAQAGCTGVSYSQATGQCDLYTDIYDPLHGPVLQDHYYKDSSSTIIVCDPVHVPAWDLILVTSDMTRLTSMTSVGSLSSGSSVVDGLVMYPFDAQTLGMTELLTSRYITDDHLHKLLVTVTEDSGVVRYIMLDMRGKISSDSLDVSDIVGHNLNPAPTTFSGAVNGLTSGTSNPVVGLYANIGCSYQHYTGTWVYDMDLEWTDWITFGLERTSCTAQLNVEVAVLQDPNLTGPAISVTFGTKSNTLVYFKIYDHGYDAHTQTMVMSHSVPCGAQQNYWLSWRQKALQFGTGDRPIASNLLYNKQISWDPKFSIKFLRIRSLNGVYTHLFREFPCKPVAIFNTTVPMLRAGGSCTQTISCIADHGLPGHTTSYDTTCQADGTWSDVHHCQFSVDAYWGEWSNWTDCSSTCGAGTIMRNRTCYDRLNAGSPCTGDSEEINACVSPDLPSCDIDGVWTDWSNWTDCSVTCGNGTITRNRTCYGQLNAGLPCSGDTIETAACVSTDLPSCDVDGVWSDWSNWTECSATCENGTWSRSRSCEGQLGTGSNCTGTDLEVEDCQLSSICEQDGSWTAWGSWDSCTITCGTGTISRSRSCEGIIGNGANCSGDPGFIETSPCIGPEPYCPVIAAWSDWSPYGECNSYCGDGNWTRTRVCEMTSPTADPNTPFSCPGEEEQIESCFTPIHSGCDVDGHWDEWSAWSVCSVTCSGGTRTRSRTCLGHQNNGVYCPGDAMETAVCGTGSCAGIGCSDFLELEHGTHDGDSLLVGTLVHHFCLQHYGFSNRRSHFMTECTRFAEWDPEILPECQLKTCPRPARNRHTWWSSDDVSHGVIMQLGCYPGYQFVDGTDRSYSECDEPNWSHTVPKCQAKTCEIPVLDHTYPYPAIISYGQYIVLQCEDGFRFSYGRTIMPLHCTTGGKLSMKLSHCQDYHCLPPPIVVNTSAEFTDDLTVAMTCLPGHRYPDGYDVKNISCVNGQWQPNILPACIVITCPPVPSITHGSANTTNAIFGTTAHFTCQEAYKTADDMPGFSIRCNEDAAWSAIVEDCIMMVCPGLPGVQFTTENSTGLSDYPVFTYIQYTCTGAGSHRFPDGHLTKSTHCTLNETWSDMPAACEENVCPPIPTLAHVVPNTTIARLGTLVGLSCETGYELGIPDQDYIIQCDSGLVWSTSPNFCTVTYCPVVSRSHLQLTTDDTEYGTVVDLACQYGYILPNDTEQLTLECAGDGSWNHSITDLKCDVRRCPDLGKVKHAKANGTGNLWQTVINFECRNGFWFRDKTFAKTVECMGDGQWSWQMEDCKLVTCPSHPTWDFLMLDITDTTWTTVVNCTCEDEYELEDYNTSSILTMCNSRGQWYPDVPECVPVNKTRDVIPTTEAPKAMDIGMVALSLMVGVFGFIIFLDVVTVGPSTYRMLKVHLRAWKVAVMALKAKDPMLAPTPFLAKLIKILNTTVSRSHPVSPAPDVEMDDVRPDNTGTGDLDEIENIDINDK